MLASDGVLLFAVRQDHGRTSSRGDTVAKATRKKSAKPARGSRAKSAGEPAGGPTAEPRALSTRTLRRLDFTFFVDNKPATVRRLRKLAETIGYDGERSLVEGSVLPEDSSHVYYLYFHVDKRDEDKARLFAHMRYCLKPTSPPPPALVQAREHGATVQRVQEEFSRSTTKDQRYLVEAQVVTPSGMRPRVVALAAPRAIDGTVFEFIGAEFKATNDRDGLRGFSWREGSDGRDTVELEYLLGDDLDWTDPWEGELERCLRYLARLI